MHDASVRRPRFPRNRRLGGPSCRDAPPGEVRRESRACLVRMERASHLDPVSVVQETPLAEKTLQQAEGEALATALAPDVRGRRELRGHEIGRQGGRASPELRCGNLRSGDPLPPERLMLGFLRRSIPPAHHGILKKLHDRNSSFPAKSQDTLVPIKGPTVTCLLMAEEFRDLVALEQDSQHILRRWGLCDQEAASDFL